MASSQSNIRLDASTPDPTSAARLRQALKEPSTPPAALVEAFHGLARFAKHQIREGRLRSTPLHAKKILQDSAEHALLRLADAQNSAEVLTSAVLFLGTSIEALEEAQRHAVLQAMCQALTSRSSMLITSLGRGELLAGIMSTLQALAQGQGDAAAWLLACTLQLWTGVDMQTVAASEAASLVNSMAPLYAGLRATATAITAAWPPATSSSRLHNLLQAVVGALESEVMQLRSAGVLAAGGMLEGATFGARGLPLEDPVIVQLHTLLGWASNDAASACELQGTAGAHLWRNAAALSFVQAVRQPGPEGGGFKCIAGSLLHSAVSLQPLFQAAAARARPAEVSTQLQQLAAGLLMQTAPAMARFVGEHYPMMPPEAQQDVRFAVSAFAKETGSSYASYVMQTPPDWLEGIEKGVVRQVLSRAFMAVVVVLDGCWRAEPHTPSRQAAQALGALACLQFCRLRTSLYSALLKDMLLGVVSDAEACAELAQQLPCYEDLAATPALGATPRWLVDSVVAARMQFLMGMLAPCAPALPQASCEHVSPFALLYLQHWHAPIAAAAHALCAALIESSPLGEQLVPAYVQRALQAYPHTTPLQGLAAGLDTVARTLPVGSSLMLLCTQWLSQRIQQLVHAELQKGPALELAKLLAHLLTVVDLQVLPGAMDIAEQCVQACNQAVRADLCSAVLQAVAASNDYTRKVACARWYQRMADRVLS